MLLVKLTEPPCTERYARWCERSGNLVKFPSYSIGDSGYLGAVNQPAIKDDEKKSKIEFRVNKRPSSLKMADDFKGLNWDKKMEHEKSVVRCKVEHQFLIVKKQMGYSKVVYRGITKNMHRFHMLFASANLIMCSRAGRTKEFIGCTV